MMSESEITVDYQGSVAILTLNRPKALNALNHSMIKPIQDYLNQWAHDKNIAVVLFKGAGDRAFCAGGDIKSIYEARDTNPKLLKDFYSDEYKLNRTIHLYPKPFIALINGITMGGGAGLSIHGHFRVAGEKTIFAMPETSIGFFPDVGGGYFLPRLHGQIGMYLGLTGNKIGSADCYFAGLATHYINETKYENLIQELSHLSFKSRPRDVSEILSKFHQNPGQSKLNEDYAAINHHFGHSSVIDILNSLVSAQNDWAQQTYQTLFTKSPTSLELTFRQLRYGAKFDFDEVLKMEYRLSQYCMKQNDFFEGVRAILIDKDQRPRWRPAALSSVAEELNIEDAFLSLGDQDLIFN
ncbi:MAG: enoyl-CoA hydratase/isomerase family protein [Alphaproteobacteria bacterium]|nr:enoyl-CoA hydratase/isomerase family protein [Alphaproteobacteria bacterium]